MTQLEDQAQTLPRNTLFLSLACLTASLFVSFLDQTAVTTAIPSISASLGDARTISSWVGSSYLIANTNFQLLYGRLSDIFGRKHMFLLSLMCLFIGNLVSGFAVNSTMLFIFRGISGVGGGGINCLVMITFSDLLSTRDRGRYFGFVAVATSLGNGLGPLIGGAFSQGVTWKWTFWISCPIAIISSILVIFFVPLKPVTGSFKVKAKRIDWIGFATALIATILVLVALSGGGTSWKWSSAIFISLFVIGIFAAIAFLVAEQKLAPIPMIPLHLFHHLVRSVLFFMCFMMGWAYFVDIYYFPLYLQNVQQWSPLMSGVIQIPATCSSSIFGVAAGFVNSKTGKYVECLWFGGAMWCLGTGLKIMFEVNSGVGLLIGANVVQGLGIGFTFQPTLLALLSNSDSSDRAVVTGLRNFFRCFGGAVGLIISGIAFSHLFAEKLKQQGIPSERIEYLVNDPGKMDTLQERTAYLNSFRWVMVILTVLSGLMFLMSFAAKDGREEEKQKEEKEREEKEREERESDSVEEVIDHVRDKT